MPVLYTCAVGHRWEAPEASESASTCPTCGLTRSFSSAGPESTRTDGDLLPPRPAPALPPLPGYEILAELGRGGMGVVYQARQLSLNRVVALKTLLRGPDARPREAEGFRAEALAIARLQHPHIVQVFDIGEHQGRLYFCMEYMEGGSLRSRLAGRPQPPAEAAKLVETLARAVHHAHGRGVVHRDLKPGNILLGADGSPRIADFGLAKLLDASGGTGEGVVMGTASYMAPEQAEGNSRHAGAAVDIWALGALLYEMLTGRPPFRGDTVTATIAQVLTAKPAPPSRLNPQTPPELDAICLRCLQKDPARRYPTAAALADDLARFPAGRPPAPAPRRSRRLLWGAAAAVVLTLALLAATVGWRALTGWPSGDGTAAAAPHWEAFQIAQDNDVYDRLAFPSRQVGYAAARHTLYKSIDGGKNWAPIRSTKEPHPIYALHFETDAAGWMSSDRLYHTDDGGDHWASADLPADAMVRSLAFGPNGRGFAAGMQGNDLVLFRRDGPDAPWKALGHDSGGYWGADPSPELFRRYIPGDIAVLNDKLVFLALFKGSSDEGALLRSLDGGDHWQPVGWGGRPGLGGEMYSVAFGGEDGGWYAGSNGLLGSIEAYGQTGVDRPNPAGAPVSCFAFDTHRSGFGLAPVWKGKVLMTRDGMKWDLDQVPLDYATPAAAVVDPGWAFVLGSDGKIARYVDPRAGEVK